MTYLYIGITLLSVYLFKRAGLFLWVKPSMEGPDGKSSARALTNAWYVALNSVITVGVMYLCFKVALAPTVNKEAVNAIWALIWLVVIYNATVLLIFGIVTAQNITSGIRAIRGTDDKEETITVKTETVSEIKPATKDEKASVTNTTTSTDIG